MKRKHIIKTILPMLLLLTAVAGGNGAWAQNHPNIGSISYNSTLGAYAITNVNNLKDLSVYVNGVGTYTTGGTETTPHNCSGLVFKQTRDILCNSNDTIRAIGSYGNSQGVSRRDLTDTWRPFNGTYDGQGHVIDALKVKGDSYFRTHTQAFFCAGFFGVVDEGTVLRNIRLVNPSVCNAISLEAVMSGRAKNGRVPVDKWYSNLVFVRYDMAGIVGVTEGGSIENCYVFNPQFRFTHADSLEFLELSTYNERALGIDMSAIYTENNSSTITGCSEVYVVREGPDVSFADNSVPSNVGFTYSGSRFYKPGSAIAIFYDQIRIGYNLGFTDGEGHNLNFSGSIPSYTITSRGNNSVITWTFTPITYQITYDNIDDATFITPNPSTYNIETETFTLNRPSREGYTFLGWIGTDLPRTTKEVTINRGSIGDRQYTAQWVEGVEPIFEVTNQGSTFTIKRDVTTTEQTVYYRTVGLTAVAGQHFTERSDAVTFAVGDSAKVINVTERTPNADAYKYQTGTSRTYRFEVLDEGGFELAHRDRTITSGLTQFSADKVSKSITNLVYFNSNGNYTSGMNSSKYLDVSYTPPTSQVETSGTLNGYVLIDDSYDYAQKPATVSTSSLINSTHATASYLNSLGYKIYATVCFTEKEKDDGYQYIQIVAGNGSASYDTGYDPEGSVNDPANSVYKVCFELSDGSNAEGKAYFPHRSTGTDEFSLSTGKLWQQKFKSGYSASGSVLLSPTVDYITTRFDAGGNNDDTWGYKNLFVRMALCDAVAPTRLGNPVVNPGPHAQGNIAYVSVAFNEIVTVVGTPILNTTWGTLRYYAGSGTNVLIFADTITANAGTRLQINSCTNYSNIKDLAGNPLNGSISYYGFASGDTVTASHDYTITYTLNGGTATPANPATYNYSTPAFTLNNPARDICVFNGWTGSDLTEALMSVTVATHSHGDKRFIANWRPLWGIASGADGSAGHPYLIATTEDLDTLAALVNRGTDFSGAYFLQTADITYDGTTNNYTPVGRLKTNPFGGSYDGGGHTISGINITTSENNIGLFGRIDSTATVQRITLASTTFTGHNNVGGIVGVNDRGTVQDCRVESTVNIYTNSSQDDYFHGGIVGSNYNHGAIRGCLCAATVSRRNYSRTARYGGIVGNNENTYPIVANCLFIGPTPTSTASVGSIAGFNYTTTILTNNYYTVSTLGGVNGNDISGARKALTVTLGTDISLVGDETVYSNSGLTAIGATALRLADGTIYSGATQTLTLAYTGNIPVGYHVVFSYNDGSDHTLASNRLTMPDADITVSSSIEATTYTISYDLAGGSVATPNPTSYTVESNITLVNPTREGYDFTGWTGTGLAEPTMSVTIADSIGDRSYTATWTPHIYAINYNLNGGSVSTPNPSTYIIESTDITLANPTRDGYTFAGWTGTGLDSATMSVTIEQGSSGDRSYTAIWTPTVYTITYNLNGGSAANPTSYTIESSDITLANPTRTGYTFAGWTGTDLDSATLSVTIEHGSTGDRSYTATWTINVYTISYDLADGSVATPNPTSYTVESADITLTNPTRDGYTFAGWTGTDLDAATLSVTIEHGSTGNRSYTATWVINFPITYDLAGGSVATPNPVYYTVLSDDITLVNPTRTGYTFLGWLGTGLTELTMSVTIPHGSTGDRTYTAAWSLDAPYSYDFEDGDGWFYWQSLSGDNRIGLGGVSHGGLGFLKFEGSTSNIVALPIFNTAASSLRLSFWTRPEASYNNYCGTFSVGYLTDPADTATFVALRTYNSTDWTPIGYRRKVVNFEGAPDGARLAFRHNPTNSNYDWFVDDVEVTAPGCFPPEDLAVSNIGVGAATFNWLAATGTQWEYALVANAAADYTPTDGDFSGTYAASQSGTQSITFSTLDEYTPYAFFLRRVCSEENKSEVESVRFRTRMTPTALPYTDDFETSNGWTLENGTLANQWVWGTAAHDDGTKSLYISNDGGTTNAYSVDTTTVVYAWKTFFFEAGKYEFSYDWRAKGEQYCAYLRVALVPDGTEFTADAVEPDEIDYYSLPSGWKALDGGEQLYGWEGWRHFVTDLITLAAGTYKMVFVWRNDDSYEENPPAAIDNVRIVKQKRFVTAGSWDNAANWEPAGVPGADENVYIEAAAVIPAGYIAVCDHADINGGSVTVADGGQLVCNSDFPVTVQKNVTAGRWNGISGLHNVWNLSPLTSDVAYDLFRYDEEHAQWLNQKAGDDAAGFNNLRYFTGYIYRRAASATINLATHNHDGNWSFNYFASCSDDALRGFNLAGNPCTHDIYFGTGIEVRSGSIAPGFYTLNADGTWRAHTTADPIHVAEAFLIQVTTDNAVLYFENTNAAPAQSKAAPAATLAFAVKGGGHEDVAYAMMGDMGLMGSMGMRKMPHLNAEAPSLSIDGYAIATLGDTAQAFPLTLIAQPGEYSIGLMGLMGDMGNVGYCHLVDKVAGRDIDLLRDSSYTFTVAAGSASGRFLVKLSPTADGVIRAPRFARWDGDRLVVSGEGTLEAYDVMGRKISEFGIRNSETSINKSTFPGTGVYILRLGGESQKIVIR